MLLLKIKSFAVVLCAVATLGMSTASYAQDNSDQIAGWHKDALSGSPHAAVQLGDTYHYGWGVKKDEEEAIRWYKLAAAGKNPAAQFAMGQAYAEGRGVKQDYKAAFDMYEKAAEQDYAPAQDSLGNIYFFGQYGVEPDKTTAIEWYRKAVKLGNVEAEYSLAEALHNGDGVVKDDKEAIILYRDAVAKGNSSANIRLEEIEGSEMGLFHTKNVPTPVLWSIGVVSVISLMLFILAMKKRGTDYGLEFILCPQFGLLIGGALFFYVTTALSTGTCDSAAQDELFCENGNNVVRWISLFTALAALALNIRRSTPWFGVLYTIAQALTAYTFLPALIMEIFRKSKKNLNKKVEY